MRLQHLASIAAVSLLVGWVHCQPLLLAGATRFAESDVRNAVAAQLGDSATRGGVDQWIERHPVEYQTRLDAAKNLRFDQYSFESKTGQRYAYLGGYDSYMWLRAARNVIRHGSPCDSIVDGECRDDYTLAPVGIRARYASLFQVTAIANAHRVLSWLVPGLPLSVSAFFVSVLVGVLGTIPAFYLGNRFGGTIGGTLCAILVGLDVTVLYRSFGADNDVWNVVLPLFQIWAVVEAIYAESRVRRWSCLFAAVLATGLHAASWSGWVFSAAIVLMGLSVNALLLVARRFLHGDGGGGRAMTSILLVVAYLVGASLVGSLAGSSDGPAAAVVRIASKAVGIAANEAPAEVRDQRSLIWPDMFGTVGELRAPSLSGIAASMAGPVYFFVSWLGLILLMLPRKRWQPWHFAILIGGNFLYRYLMTQANASPWVLATLLLIPLVVGLGAYLADRHRPVEDQGAGAVIILWFLGALVMAHRGTRFLLLLAPPLAVLFGVAAGRLYEWVARQPVASPAWVRGGVFVALLATVWPPVSRGIEMGRGYLPVMNDGWHAAMVRLRDATAADSIVDTWWDYGYFTKYYAERRVLADGGTLRAHVHYWFARALLATDEMEALGILRMLNCGSDAFPEPEGELGAFGKLRAAGVPEAIAYRSILAVAPLDRGHAERYLRGIGMSAEAVADVLGSTHCTPPPGYLLLPQQMVVALGWQHAGSWSFVDAYVARRHGSVSDADLAREVVARFAIDRASAAAAVERVAEGRPSRGRRLRFATRTWVDCSGDARLACAASAVLQGGDKVRAVRMSIDDPMSVRLSLLRNDGEETDVKPSLVVIAEEGGTRRFDLGDEHGDAPGVLMDLVRRRVLVASPELLDSLFTQLVFLDGRYLDRFEKFDDRSGAGGRITTWRIRW